MKLKYHFETIIIENTIRMIPVGSKDFNGVMTVNETMKDIMDLLEKERTEEEVVSAMLELYSGASRYEIALNVRKVCNDLRKEGLLEG